MGEVRPLWKRGVGASAFETRMAPHLDRMWRLALRLQGNPTDAEDLVQDLLLRAWKHRRTLLALEAPGPWLARVIYRLHVDRWRRRGVLGDALSMDDEDHPVAVPDPAAPEAVLASADLDATLDAIGRLPEAQRTVLLMHDAEGYTIEEISRIQDVPVGTLKSRLHRARAAVRKRISDGTFSPPAAC